MTDFSTSPGTSPQPSRIDEIFESISMGGSIDGDERLLRTLSPEDLASMRTRVEDELAAEAGVSGVAYWMDAAADARAFGAHSSSMDEYYDGEARAEARAEESHSPRYYTLKSRLELIERLFEEKSEAANS